MKIGNSLMDCLSGITAREEEENITFRGNYHKPKYNVSASCELVFETIWGYMIKHAIVNTISSITP